MKKGLIIFVGVFLYFAISAAYFSKVVVYADELKEDVENILQDETEYVYKILNEEDDQENEEELEDVIMPLRMTKSGEPINTYDERKSWLFNEAYYNCQIRYIYGNGNVVNDSGYGFSSSEFGDRTEELINIFAENKNYYMCNDDNGNYIVFNNKGRSVSSCSLKNGLPSEVNNLNWFIPEPDLKPDPDPDPTPTPDPDPTPTPAPDPTPTIEPDPDPDQPNNNLGFDVLIERFDDMTANDQNFKYILVFALGSIAGVLTGQFLFGWIK